MNLKCFGKHRSGVKVIIGKRLYNHVNSIEIKPMNVFWSNFQLAWHKRMNEWTLLIFRSWVKDQLQMWDVQEWYDFAIFWFVLVSCPCHFNDSFSSCMFEPFALVNPRFLQPVSKWCRGQFPIVAFVGCSFINLSRIPEWSWAEDWTKLFIHTTWHTTCMNFFAIKNIKNFMLPFWLEFSFVSLIRQKKNNVMYVSSHPAYPNFYAMIWGILFLSCLSHSLSVCLFVSLSVVNFNLRYNFWTVRDRDFIFGKHTPRMTPRSRTLWPWLWPGS